MASAEFDLTLEHYGQPTKYQDNDAASFDIRRSGTYEEPFMTSAPVLATEMDEDQLLRSSSSSVELFSNDSVLLTQRPVPTLDYFVDLPVIVEHNLETAQLDEKSEADAENQKQIEEKEPKPQKPQVAEIVYVDDPNEGRPLTEHEREFLQARALARERKLKRNAENRQLLQTDSVKHVLETSVTHVKNPSKEIRYITDEKPWWCNKRGVGPGNAVKISSGGKWMHGLVNGVSVDGTRVSISYKGYSSSWYNRGKLRFYSTVLPYDSPDWFPVKTRTIPGTARRGRPAKVDDYFPDPPRPRDDNESYSSPSYYYSSSSRSGRPSAPESDDTPSHTISTPLPRKSNTKQRDLVPLVEVEKTRRFKFQPGAQQDDSETVTDDSYAQRKLERQRQRYAKYEEFLQKISKNAPVFRVRVVVDEKPSTNSDENDADEGDEEDTIASLVAPIAYAETNVETQNEDSNFPPRASIFFDRVEGIRGILGDIIDNDALFQLSPSGEDTFFTELDERSRQLFDEYMEFALEDALNSSSDDFDLDSSSGGLSRSLASSGDLENDEMLLRRSGSLAYAHENSRAATPIPVVPDSEMLHQLNDGIYAPEESAGFDVDGLLKHYSYIVSAPEKKRKPRDLFDAPPTAQERTLVIANAPEPQFHVLTAKSTLNAVLQPSIAEKDVTAIPDFEDLRARKMMDSSTKPLNAREILFASEDSLSNDLKSQVRVFFDGTSLEELQNNHFSYEFNADDDYSQDGPNVDSEPSLTDPSVWKFETDLLIDKTEEPNQKDEWDQAKPSRSRQRGCDGARAVRESSVSSEAPKTKPSPAKVDLSCEVCNCTFWDRHQMADHMASRLHRENVWRNKQALAAQKNASLFRQ